MSQFGSEVTSLALPLAAIIVLDASTFEVAALAVVDWLPFFVLSLPAGVWIDRLPRRPIMITADWGRALALASIPLAYLFDVLTLGQLYVVGLIVGTLTMFFELSYQSYLPSVVERDELGEGNSKLEVSRSSAQVAGPGLAGVLVSVLTAPYAILVDAISFVASALSLSRIKREERTPERAGRDGPRFRADIAEGLRFTLRHPLQRPIIVYVAVSNLFVNMLCDLSRIRGQRARSLSHNHRIDLFAREHRLTRGRADGESRGARLRDRPWSNRDCNCGWSRTPPDSSRGGRCSCATPRHRESGLGITF
ncbi:hypothetical protein BH18ACT13_BH18ACT13_13300 [soil metagenome]